MNTLTLKRLGLVVLVLLVGWGLVTVLRGDLGEEIARRSWPGVTGVTSITMTGSYDTVALTLGDDGQWLINGHEPSAESVTEVLTLLADSLSGELAARTVASHTRLGVDSATGRHIAVRRGPELAQEFWFGRPGQVFHSIYMRVAGDSAVYHHQGRLAPLLTQGLELWRERRMAAVPVEAIHSITVARPHGGYTLRRADAWSLRGAATDTAQVARLLGEFASLRARNFPSEADAAAATFRSSWQVTLLGEAGDTLLALQLDSTSAGWLGRRAGGRTVWHVDAWLPERLMPADSVLLRSEP